jgi:hypothetical protein
LQGDVSGITSDMKTRGSVEAVVGIYRLLPTDTRRVGDRDVSPFTLVRDCGLNIFFMALSGMTGIRKGKALMLALATYWWDVTHTFHFKWGEATITPIDYAAITGLSFKGQGIEWKDGYTDRQLEMLLGFSPYPKKGDGMQYADVGREIEKMMQRYEARNPEILPEHIARSFIWFALSNTLFGHAEGTALFSLLGSLEDLERVDGYSWGEAGLAETYFALDNFTRLGLTSLYCFEFVLEVRILLLSLYL